MCGVSERSSRVSGSVPDVSQFLDRDRGKKMGHAEVTNGCSENDAQHFRDATCAQRPVKS